MQDGMIVYYKGKVFFTQQRHTGLSLVDRDGDCILNHAENLEWIAEEGEGCKVVNSMMIDWDRVREGTLLESHAYGGIYKVTSTGEECTAFNIVSHDSVRIYQRSNARMYEIIAPRLHNDIE